MSPSGRRNSPRADSRYMYYLRLLRRFWAEENEVVFLWACVHRGLPAVVQAYPHVPVLCTRGGSRGGSRGGCASRRPEGEGGWVRGRALECVVCVGVAGGV